MGQQTTPIQPTTFFRQSSAPTGAPDGAVWQNPSDGAGGDTSSRYVYNANAGQWELDSAVGPSEPTDGVNSAGAIWRDTANGVAKQYDGEAFVSLSPTATGAYSAATWSLMPGMGSLSDGDTSSGSFISFSGGASGETVTTECYGGPSLRARYYISEDTTDLSYNWVEFRDNQGNQLGRDNAPSKDEFNQINFNGSGVPAIIAVNADNANAGGRSDTLAEVQYKPVVADHTHTL